jgi:hypothetical protein
VEWTEVEEPRDLVLLVQRQHERIRMLRDELDRLQQNPELYSELFPYKYSRLVRIVRRHWALRRRLRWMGCGRYCGWILSLWAPISFRALVARDEPLEPPIRNSE